MAGVLHEPGAPGDHVSHAHVHVHLARSPVPAHVSVWLAHCSCRVRVRGVPGWCTCSDTTRILIWHNIILKYGGKRALTCRDTELAVSE